MIWRLLLALALVACQDKAQPVAPPPPAPSSALVQPRVDLVKVPFLDDVRDSAQFYFGIPAPIGLLLGQMAQESGFDPNARSPVGAVGLYQFMPATWEWARKTSGYDLGASPLNPKDSIRAGIWYDKFLYDRVNYSQPCHRWGAALSSFNGGLGWHNKRQAIAKDPDDFWNSVRTINPGISDNNQIENQSYSYRIVYGQQPKFVQTLGKKICL